MKAGKYSLKDFFTNRYISQIIIPEIQRDYVWQEEQVKGLLDSIKVDYEKYKEFSLTLSIDSIDDEDMKSDIESFIRKRKHASNIGFIYAYNDTDFRDKYFLIDGQQRITTMFLVLLALTSESTAIAEQFKKNYRQEEKPKLDYKVREETQAFLDKFIGFVLSNEKGKVEEQIWFYDILKSDVTINSLKTNYAFIIEYLRDIDGKEELYDYIENLVEFWYFDTNVSEQGEELYIYMNARGEQMQGNENIKAQLLSKKNTIEEKNKWGKKWEVWQDFFWINRNSSRKERFNLNADKGFNEFLAAISGLERYKNGDISEFYQKDKFDKFNSISTQKIVDNLSLETIEKYVKALMVLEEEKVDFKKDYQYSDWVEDSIVDIWHLFNIENTNWYAKYDDDNRATERNRMVYLWSVLHLATKVDGEKLFHGLRFFYLRYNNNIRSVLANGKPVLIETVHQIIEAPTEFLFFNSDAFWSDEEKSKGILLRNNRENISLLRKLREAIWRIEDSPLNIDGSDVKGINISHLVDFDSELTLERLEEVYSVFSVLLDEGNKNKLRPIVRNILLYYGEYWSRVSPWYYERYYFGDWKRIIRSSIFKKFFEDLKERENIDLQVFLAEKKSAHTSVNDCSLFLKKLYSLSSKHGDMMWNEWEYMAIPNRNDFKKYAVPDEDEFPIFNVEKYLGKGGKKYLTI